MKMTRMRALGVDREALRAHTEDNSFLDQYPNEEFRLRRQVVGEFLDGRRLGDDLYSGLVLVRVCLVRLGVCRLQLDAPPLEHLIRDALRAALPDDEEWFERHPHEELRVRPYFAFEFPDYMGPGRVRYRAILSRDPNALPFMICVHCERGDDNA